MPESSYIRREGGGKRALSSVGNMADLSFDRHETAAEMPLPDEWM
jgi:hypothetical protein